MKFVVKCGGGLTWKDEHSEVDMLREAAIRSLRQRKEKNKPFLVTVVLECSLKKVGKKPKTVFFNTYYILKLAGLDKEADVLRKKFLKTHGIDVKKEPEHDNVA